MILSFVGVFISSAILIWGLVGEYKDPHSSVMITLGAWSLRKFPLLVIIGVAGELVFNTISFVSSITLDVWHSAEVTQINSVASEAYKVGNMARENAAGALGRAVTAEFGATAAYRKASEAYERAAKVNERAKDTELEVENLKKENTVLTGRLHDIDILTGDRDMNEAERGRLKNSLKGRRHEITVVMIDDREAHEYAKKIIAALNAAGAVVKIESARSSPETGVVVCENNREDLRIANALNVAGIVIRRLNQKVKKGPELCDHSPDSAPPVRNIGGIVSQILDADTSASPRRGTVVIVGQRIPIRVRPQ